MRQKVVKRIRKQVYGDNSHNVKKKYVMDHKTGKIINEPLSLRSIFKKAKKIYQAGGNWYGFVDACRRA